MPTHTPPPTEQLNPMSRLTLLALAALLPVAPAVAGQIWSILLACRPPKDPFDDPLLALLVCAGFPASVVITIHAIATERFVLVPSRRDFTGKCFDCGYNLDGLPRSDGGGVCPECGVAFHVSGATLVKERRVNVARGVIAAGGLLMCLVSPAIVDMTWSAMYRLKGRSPEFIDCAMTLDLERGGSTSRASLGTQLFLLMLALGITSRFSPIAHPARTIIVLHLGWTLVFTLLTLPFFESIWWWTNINPDVPTSWYVLPVFAGLVVLCTPRSDRREIQ